MFSDFFVLVQNLAFHTAFFAFTLLLCGHIIIENCARWTNFKHMFTTSETCNKKFNHLPANSVNFGFCASKIQIIPFILSVANTEAVSKRGKNWNTKLCDIFKLNISHIRRMKRHCWFWTHDAESLNGQSASSGQRNPYYVLYCPHSSTKPRNHQTAYWKLHFFKEIFVSDQKHCFFLNSHHRDSSNLLCRLHFIQFKMHSMHRTKCVYG